MARSGMNCLRRDPQLVTRFPHASFDNDIRIKTAAHFADVEGRPLELERRGSRDHLQSCDAGKRVDNFFANPVAKVVLLRFRTHIHEWQNRNGCARLDRGADFLGLVARLGIQPAKNRDVTAGPQTNQDRVIAPRTLIIFLELSSKSPASTRTIASIFGSYSDERSKTSIAIENSFRLSRSSPAVRFTIWVRNRHSRAEETNLGLSTIRANCSATAAAGTACAGAWADVSSDDEPDMVVLGVRSV